MKSDWLFCFYSLIAIGWKKDAVWINRTFESQSDCKDNQWFQNGFYKEEIFGKKKDIVKRVHKTVTLGCKLCPRKQRWEKRFESMSLRIPSTIYCASVRSARGKKIVYELRNISCCWLKFDHFHNLSPTMLRYVALYCCNSLARALRLWATKNDL